MVPDTEQNSFARFANILLPAAMKWKSKMKKHNLTRATANCPMCGGKDTVQMVLAGRKQHIHLACTAEGCNTQLME